MQGFFSVGGGGYDRDVNNDVSARNVYGGASGATLGQRSAAMSPYAIRGASVDSDSGDVVDAGASSAGSGLFGKPVTWWLVILALLFALMFVAKKAGQDSEFSNVRLSAYNIATITLAAVVGIGFLKVVFGRFQVPGLSTYVAAL